MDDPIQTIESKVVYQNHWITIHEDKTRLPSGREGLYGYLESKDSVMAAVFDEQNRICMVRAFRYPSKSWGWELPGGSGEDENLLDASKREFEEKLALGPTHGNGPATLSSVTVSCPNAW